MFQTFKDKLYTILVIISIFSGFFVAMAIISGIYWLESSGIFDFLVNLVRFGN